LLLVNLVNGAIVTGNLTREYGIVTGALTRLDGFVGLI